MNPKVAWSVAGVVAVCGLLAGVITWVVWSTGNQHAAPQRQLATQDWWEHCVLYQIYPRSFKDSDSDGVGDLRALRGIPHVVYGTRLRVGLEMHTRIISELAHFAESGVDAIWLSPIFESPMVDFGYDISNYYDIHDEYGSMEDFEDLLELAHGMGIKVLLDFVPNHASIESDYFNKSEAEDPHYKDFFIWADPIWTDQNETYRQPPSNWVSLFGGSAWKWSEKRQQYYLHQFSSDQADFNFRNQAVKEEMLNIMTFWLDKGVDGFRIDALPYLLEANPVDHDNSYPDNPLSGSSFVENEVGYTIPLYTKDLIELYEIVYEWRNFVDDYQKKHGGNTRVLFTEGYTNISMTMLYYGNENNPGAHFPFNFGFITDLSTNSDARDFVYNILKWLIYKPSGAVANWVFGNHDNKRMPTRFRNDMVDGLNAISMILPGVAVTYQGEEIGMRDGYVSWEDTVDVEACSRGDSETYEQYSRDPARTPYHWDNSTSAGFSSTEDTWLPVADDYEEINLAQQKEDDRSHYKVYQALTNLRKTEPSLSQGDCDVTPLSKNTFYITRSLPGFATVVLVFNVSGDHDVVDLGGIKYFREPAVVHISSIHSNKRPGDTLHKKTIKLAPGEALVLRVAGRDA